MIDFNNLIDNYLAREHKPKSIGKYYPSEIGGCLRKTWFSYKIPKKIKTELLRIFEAGNMLHEFVTEVIKSEKNKEVELLKSEMPIRVHGKDFVISGRIDNLVLLRVDGKELLVEVKSTKFLPDEPKSDNIMQLQFYMYAAKIWDGAILYIQKDNLQTKTFHIRCRKQTIQKILERFENLHESLITDKIPEAEAKLDENKKWMCMYCDYKEECEKAGRYML